MSWSVSAVGKSQKVAQKLAEDFASIKCSEPEESIKNGVASSIAQALAAFPAGNAVRVQANGSQYVPYAKNPEVAINTLNVKIEPFYSFLE